MHQKKSVSSATFGWILIILGLLFLLDNFHFIDFDYLLDEFWPVILIIIGVYIILKHRKSEEKKRKEIIDSSLE